MTDDYLTLKWGTLKAWHITSDKGLELLKRYGSAQRRNTPEQKELLCQIIDACGADTIYLDWDGAYVTKAEARRYVMEYDQETKATPEAKP